MVPRLVRPNVLFEEWYARGLAWPRKPMKDLKLHRLDMHSGQLFLPADPEKVLWIVNDARKLATSEDYGPHNGLLSQKTLRSNLTNDLVYWFQPYEVPKGAGAILTLKDWLEEQGFPYVPPGA